MASGVGGRESVTESDGRWQMGMQRQEIGIGIVGGGYMGKAHAVAMSAVGAVFDTRLRPRLAMVAASTPQSADRYRSQYGFDRATDDFRVLVDDPQVEAVVIASPQSTHRAIAERALALAKPVFCEKPLGASLSDSRAMVRAAEAAGVPHMVGFNYIRTPASQFARHLVASGEIGEITWFRGEHTEDGLADPASPATWRTEGDANGTLGDLAPHMINAALAFMGGIREVVGDCETVIARRPSADGFGDVAVTNDDQAQAVCRFDSGAMGHLHFSRVATGRKMGYRYEITGTRGAIRFDQEDQNCVWLYRMDDAAPEQGFRQILTGPEHPDYRPFCQGAGHGTGYQDQIIIEARDFLQAIETGKPAWPTFHDGLEVNQVIEAIRQSARRREWVSVADFR